MESSPWVTLSLTHVAYRKDDLVSLILGVSSLAPLVILVGFVTLILFRRDLHTMFFCLGQVGNEGLNFLLKHWVQERRPHLPGYPDAHTGRFGWPSSHAQFISFFTVYSLLFLYIRLGRGSERVSWWKAFLSLGLILLSGVILYGRVEMGHHSLSQVAWGALIGAAVGAAWFAVVHKGLSPWFPWVASWSVCEWAMVRDYTLIPSSLFFDYTCARAEARARARKHSLHNSKRH